jgi:hypothetical protein
MPDPEGNVKGEETSTPLHAYKDGREEDVLDPEATEEGHPEASDQSGPGLSGAPSADAPEFGGREGSGDDSGAASGDSDQGLGAKTGGVESPEEGGEGREGRPQV